MLLMLMWRVSSFFYNHLDTAHADVNVGILFDSAIAKPHGLARVRLQDNSFVTIAFIVDKPRFLFFPSKLTVVHLFNQFSKMGMYCQSLRVKYGFWTDIHYQRSNIKEWVMEPKQYKKKEYVIKTVL